MSTQPVAAGNLSTLSQLKRQVEALEAELLRAQQRVGDAEARAARAEKAAQDAWQFAKWVTPLRTC